VRRATGADGAGFAGARNPVWFIAGETEKWAKLIKFAGIKPE
jgi:hypothetical protein